MAVGWTNHTAFFSNHSTIELAWPFQGNNLWPHSSHATSLPTTIKGFKSHDLCSWIQTQTLQMYQWRPELIATNPKLSSKAFWCALKSPCPPQALYSERIHRKSSLMGTGIHQCNPLNYPPMYTELAQLWHQFVIKLAQLLSAHLWLWAANQWGFQISNAALQRKQNKWI